MIGHYSHTYSHFFKYFLSTYCEFNFLLYVYTIATERYQTNTKIMKTIKVTYTEVQYITYTKEIEVTNAQLKELQKEGQFHGQLLEAMEHQAAQHGEQIVNSRQMELNF